MNEKAEKRNKFYEDKVQNMASCEQKKKQRMKGGEERVPLMQRERITERVRTKFYRAGRRSKRDAL